MKRRDFFSLVSGGLGATAFISCSKEFLNEPSLVSAARPGGGGGGTATWPPTKLRIPEVVGNPIPSGHQLICKNGGSMDVGGKIVSNLWSYDGEYPAKTLVARRGETVSIKLKNTLQEETITHWHGMIVDHHNDGGPMNAVPAGGLPYEYNFPVVQRAALNWYHPHPHMLTGKQVNLGMAGAFIIRDDFEDRFNLPRGNANVPDEAPYEIPLILRDATIDKNGNLSYKPTSGGFNGQVSMVNGIINPYLTVKRGVYRFRILNGANSRIFGLGLNVTNKLRLIGNDGGLLPTVSSPTRMDISPAERLDVLIDFSSYTDGTNIYLKDLRAGINLLEFRISGVQAETFMFPAVGTTLATDIVQLSGPVNPTREFSFDGMTKINGLEYNMGRIDWQVNWGDTERWRFKTNGNAPHPVHIHGASFQVISRTGGRANIYDWERGWKDTVLLEDSETVDVFIRFDGKDLEGIQYKSTPADPDKGKYLMHCHKLEHEDLGMMANFEVV